MGGQGWKVRFQRPVLPEIDKIGRYFAASEEANWYSNFGPCHELLGRRLSEYVGDGVHCIPVSSGTIGLIVALRALALDDPERNEVIVPSYTFVATVSAITWCGFRPVFVDVDADHWSPSDAGIGDALEGRGSRVAAVLSCTTFGTAPPREVSEGWETACREAGVPLIVDSAPGFGSTDEEGTPVGGRGDAQIVSFHATKPFGIGEGGAVFTKSEDCAARVRALINFGLAGRRIEDHPGINGKLSELHAAVGLAVLDEFEEILAARRGAAARISSTAVRNGFSVQANAERSTFQFVPILAPDAESREALIAEADRRSIQLRTYHEPLHQAPSLADFERVGNLETTEDLGSRTVSLPMASRIGVDEVDAIADLLESAQK